MNRLLKAECGVVGEHNTPVARDPGKIGTHSQAPSARPSGIQEAGSWSSGGMAPQPFSLHRKYLKLLEEGQQILSLESIGEDSLSPAKEAKHAPQEEGRHMLWVFGDLLPWALEQAHRNREPQDLQSEKN